MNKSIKMREYVDSIQGKGAWDHMHERISQMKLSGWTLPPVEVDGNKVNIFPGFNTEVTLEEVKAEIRKALKQIDETTGMDHFEDED